ncbi:hypothetical protein WP8W19C03_22790 [Aeromonas veronii]|nr:hypothetical protein WP8W19C03_22790 [Aeromonas veronii]
MTTNEKVARRKLSLLDLAKELNIVSKACKLIGYSRQQFYEIRRNYQTNSWPAAGRARAGSARHQCQCGWCAWRVATARLAL